MPAQRNMLNFEAILGAEGPLARVLHGFRPRPAQQQMATRIEAALHAREVLLVEAGTGTGKTFAYLVPALLSGLRVLISTGTRTLQDQLYHRDLPLLAGAPWVGRRASRCSRARQLPVPRAAGRASGGRPSCCPPAADAVLHADRSTGRRRRAAAIWRSCRNSPTPIRCGRRSPPRARTAAARAAPSIARCHVFEARRAALEADIVVVNHHLLLADLALKEDGFGDLLPSVDAVILDEAHQLPDLASEFFGVSVSSRQIELLLADLSAGARRRACRRASRRGQRRSSARWPPRRCLRAAWSGTLALAATGRDAHQALAALQRLPRARRRRARRAAGRGSRAAARAPTRARALAAALGQIIDVGPARARRRRSEPVRQGDDRRPHRWPARARVSTVRAALRCACCRTRSRAASARCRRARAAPGSSPRRRSRSVRTSVTSPAASGSRVRATVRFDSPFDYARQALLYLPRGAAGARPIRASRRGRASRPRCR